ncbi:hypothetical protein [Sabulicella rubraurantiaca]|uniref:hypothetical protein n=1 Tax=Sabulicella rubraurantiaca TaxID=2811429 RepID=UPI001A976A25|nr:hypothetical protein [Sabulicella rubraurantiaca]
MANEDSLAQAERHVREGEERVTRQRAIVEELERDNHPEAAALGRATLETFLATLEQMREHLRLERKRYGLEP